MNIFKTIRNTIKLKQFNKIIRELCCDGQCCRNCPGFLPGCSRSGRACALSAAIDIALDKWGLKKEEE